MINSLKKKIELSNLLGRIETDFNSKEIVSDLDKCHGLPKAHVIGITGAPGAGKSSMIDKLIKYIRKKKKSVGVIAIDPSSEKSGGALLGDRTRLLLDPMDENIFVRSMASKNMLGGISELTFPTMVVMRSIFDFIIIETVGVGQSEIFIRDIADTVILGVQPGSGDTIQFMKSGIFEIPDIIVVTKSDITKLADITYADLSGSKGYFQNQDAWNINIIMISSFKDIGFDSLYNELILRWKWLGEKNNLYKMRLNQDLKWIKNKISKSYGEKGLQKVENDIDYQGLPFSTLKKISEKLDL